MTRPLANFLLALGLLLPCNAAVATAFFSAANQDAFARGFLLPALGESRVLSAEDWTWQAQLDLSNDYLLQGQGDETIFKDGETLRLGYVLRQGLGEGLEWNLELPIFYQGGGFMDGFIENWHGWFGLPNGGRELAAQDQYRYEVRRGDTVVFQNTDTGPAFGDVRVGLGWQAGEAWVWRVAAMLPSGNHRKLTGENLGLAVWADGELPFNLGHCWDSLLSLGITAAKSGKVLDEQQKNYAGFGGLGLSYSYSEALRFTAQVYAHSALYRESELRALRRPGVQLVFGGSYQFLPNAGFKLAVQEDIVTASSPDFGVHMSITLSPEE